MAMYHKLIFFTLDFSAAEAGAGTRVINKTLKAPISHEISLSKLVH